jgi:hypothetical protein
VISLEQYLAGHKETPREDVLANAVDLLERVDALLSQIDLPDAQHPRVNSGWRPAAYNAGVPNASPTSKHITGQAIDLADPSGELDAYLMQNLDALTRCGLYLEHPDSTPRWCHVQSVAPHSGNRVFRP